MTDLKDFIESISNYLDGTDYGQGQLEDIQQTQGNIIQYLTNLTMLLIDKGVLDAENDSFELFNNLYS